MSNLIIPKSRFDPTGTKPIQDRFIAQLDKRYEWLKQQIGSMMLVDDAFAIVHRKPVGNIRFDFPTDERKVEAFRKWLSMKVRTGILSAPGASDPKEPWTSEFVESTYKQSINSAFAAVSSKDSDRILLPDEAERTEFLQSMLESNIATKQLERLNTRCFENLKNVTPDMSDRMADVITEGLANGDDPFSIARALDRETDIGRARARQVARTEVVHSYAEGSLDTMEELQVEGVDVEAEVLNGGDPCPECEEVAAQSYSIDEARGLIPVHPNCCCAPIPKV